MQQTLPANISKAQAKLLAIKKLVEDDMVCCFCGSWFFMNVEAIVNDKWVCPHCLNTYDLSQKKCGHCGRDQVTLVETKKRMP